MTFSRCATYASPASPIVRRWPLGDDGGRVNEAPELALSHSASEAVGRAERALEPNLALDATAAGPPRAVPAGAPAAVNDDVEASGAVGALRHAGHLADGLGCGARRNWKPIGTLSRLSAPPCNRNAGLAPGPRIVPGRTKAPLVRGFRSVGAGAVTATVGE